MINIQWHYLATAHEKIYPPIITRPLVPGSFVNLGQLLHDPFKPSVRLQLTDDLCRILDIEVTKGYYSSGINH